MLMPKKVKYRKQQRGRMTGKAWRGSSISFGDYGLKALECGWITDRQIEAARVAMTRFIKRGGKVWIRLFPDKPITKKPAETRMGKGKGAPEQWVAVIRPGKMLFEMEGVDAVTAKQAMSLAAAQAAHPDQAGVARQRRSKGKAMRSQKIRDLDSPELQRQLRDIDEQLFRLRLQMSMGQMDGLKKVRSMKKTRARIFTILRERELAEQAAGEKGNVWPRKRRATRTKRSAKWFRPR